MKKVENSIFTILRSYDFTFFTMRKINYYFWMVLSLVGCSRYPSDVESALKLAKENRAELERVIEHYRQEPKDSLKLKAAYFLIANMPFHFTVQDERVDSFKFVLLNEQELNEHRVNTLLEKYEQTNGKIEIKRDLFSISSKFLIRHIDFSFKVWQETPWCENFSLDVFFEEILPYRLNHEPLEFWKEDYYAMFRPVVDSMENNQYPDEVCMRLVQYINDQGWLWGLSLNSHGFGASALLKTRYGTCKEQAEFVAYIMRSLGIPAGIDRTIQNPVHLPSVHYWNYTRNNNAEPVVFDFFNINLKRSRREMSKLGKVVRQCFAFQKETLPVKYKKKFIPFGGLRDVLLQDVSSEYFPKTHITVRPERAGLIKRKDIVYLCTFNNREWAPLAWCELKNGMANFYHVEPDLLYQIRLIDDSRSTAVSKPFIFSGQNNVQFLDADTSNLQSMTLLRKYLFPEIWPHYITRILGGRFQGANHADFNNLETYYTILQPADLRWHFIYPEQTAKFQYVRYLSAPDGHNNMAEIQFFSDGKRLKGEVIGTEDAWIEYPRGDKFSAFDGDPLSYFEASEADGSWVGLKFDKAYRIDAIRYIFRNDDNNIRVGDTYELLYHKNGQWLSAGKQTADTTLLLYENVPSNTLYWLRNHTRGREERPFIYVDGEQVFY